jgi:hypothetical protein
VRTSTIIVLTFLTALSGSRAYAQAEQPAVHHHNHVPHSYGPHHTVHHHAVAHNPAPIPESTAASPRPGEVANSHQTNQMFKPYA